MWGSHARSVMQAGHANHPNCKSASRMEWLAPSAIISTKRSAVFDTGWARLRLGPCHVRRRPTFDEFSQSVESVREFVGHCCETQTEMRGRVETISGREQDALFCSCLAKGTAILSS